jgi:predicted nucleic-acid-binding protein
MNSLTRMEPGWIALATILELVWGITRKAGDKRRDVIPILDFLLARDEIVIEQSRVVEIALQKLRSGNADFADCLIAASVAAAGCTQTVTFDRIAARGTGMQLIG